MKLRALYILLFIIANLLLRVTLCTDGACSVSHQCCGQPEGIFHFDRAIDDVGIITEPTTPITIGTQNVSRGGHNVGVEVSGRRGMPRLYRIARAITNICKTSSHPHTLYYIFALHRMRD